jgi:hypothetical protein
MRIAVAAVLALVVCSLVAGCGTRKRLMCERKMEGVAVTPGEVVWFGEMHGTEESPRFVGDVVCYAARGYHVQLALEIPQEEQMRIHRYLMDGQRDALLAGAFWGGSDGRSSEAMVGLLDRVREMRKSGGRIEVVAYDVHEVDRDRAMAQAVMAARNPGAVFVGLSGNVHSRKTPFRDTETLVGHLLANKLTVRTHDVSASGGTMWACLGDDEAVCGEHPNRNDDSAQTPWTVGPARDDSHDAVYFVGPTKASRPARQSL